VRKWIATVIGSALLVGGTAQAQTSKDIYPNRPVRIIVPFGAGGPGDIFARLIGQKLSQQLGQQFVIENRPGAGGNIGAAVVARAPADGYTLLVGSSTLWVNASLYPQIPYDPVRDFEPIIIGATSPVCPARCKRHRSVSGHPPVRHARSSIFCTARSRVRLLRRTSRRKWRR